jgi:cation transport protein ChaC
MGKIWVFGYGSLMWDNEQYQPIKIKKATLKGMHRSFNRLSTVSRGTKSNPGLVLGLEDGEECLGIAIQIDESFLDKSPDDKTISLREREMGKMGAKKPSEKVGGYYESKERQIIINDGPIIENCIVYLPNPSSVNFIKKGSMTLKEKALIAINSKPPSGNPTDYVFNLYDECKKLEINDKYLDEMYNKIKELK